MYSLLVYLYINIERERCHKFIQYTLQGTSNRIRDSNIRTIEQALLLFCHLSVEDVLGPLAQWTFGASKRFQHSSILIAPVVGALKVTSFSCRRTSCSARLKFAKALLGSSPGCRLCCLSIMRRVVPQSICQLGEAPLIWKDSRVRMSDHKMLDDADRQPNRI